MNNILDRDDLTIMKRAIFSTQVIRKKHLPYPIVIKFYLISILMYWNVLIWNIFRPEAKKDILT